MHFSHIPLPLFIYLFIFLSPDFCFVYWEETKHLGDSLHLKVKLFNGFLSLLTVFTELESLLPIVTLLPTI
jgi:hypothetical protein